MNDLTHVEPLQRVPTGIRGFEHISLGGLVEGRTTLLVGTSGSVDADDTDVAMEHMSEEELLKGLEGLTPPEAQPEEEE